jgi:hypothetical protein
MSNRNELWIDWIGSPPRNWWQWLIQSALGALLAAIWWWSDIGSSFVAPFLWLLLVLITGAQLLARKRKRPDA